MATIQVPPIYESKESYGMKGWFQQITAAINNLQAVPVGAMMDFAGTSAPDGWLLCDGSAVSRTDYADLFTAIGTTWGSGNGTTTFNVPDFRRRVAVGSGGTGTSTLGNSVGNTGGEETHLLTAAESGLPAHGHSASSSASSSGSFNVRDNVSGTSGVTFYTGSASAVLNKASGGLSHDLGDQVVSVSTSVSTTVNANSAASASSAHNNVQPSAVVLKIIKV